jgi:flagellar biosynthesis/type III secretory pathway M-ring protein FliF/YscJ
VKPNVMVAAMPDGTMMPVGMGGANAGAPALAPGTTRVVGPDGREMVQVAGGPLLDPETGEPIESIAERVDVPLEQIKKMSQERPDVVAMLLKSWLLEERR